MRARRRRNLISSRGAPVASALRAVHPANNDSFWPLPLGSHAAGCVNCQQWDLCVGPSAAVRRFSEDFLRRWRSEDVSSEESTLPPVLIARSRGCFHEVVNFCHDISPADRTLPHSSSYLDTQNCCAIQICAARSKAAPIREIGRNRAASRNLMFECMVRIRLNPSRVVRPQHAPPVESLIQHQTEHWSIKHITDLVVAEIDQFSPEGSQRVLARVLNIDPLKSQG